MEGTYTIWRITTISPDKVRLEMETNDDDDDGVSGEVVVWARNMSMKTALEIAGHKSHRGLYGQPVDVYLDGRKI